MKMPSKIINNLKGYEKIKELIEDEISDYSYFEAGDLEWDDNYGDYLEEDTNEHYMININCGNSREVTLRFNYDSDGKIEIEIGEDVFYEVCSYDYKVKYFWMALLKW